jgi:flagellar basal body-associated protein FliL
MDITFIDIAHFFSGLYSLILILIGTPLNLLCFYIFTRLVPNRSNPTIIVFAHLALIELLIPFTWNINYVVRELLWKYQKHISLKNLEQHSLFVCKLISYSAYFSLQCAAWLKTLATFARCVSLNHQWSLNKYLSKSIIIRRVILIVIFLIGLINFPIWIINGKRISLQNNQTNQTEIQIKCYYQSKFFQFWEIIHLLLYNFIPFTLMIICNILIIRQVRDSRRRTQRSKLSLTTSNNRNTRSNEGGRLTKTLILITIFFIMFTSPAAIFYIFLGKIIRRHRNLITMNLSNLATTSHVTSFIIYWLSSTDFRDAAISVLCCRPIVSVHRQPTIEEKQQDIKPISNQTLTEQSNDENQRKLPLLQS